MELKTLKEKQSYNGKSTEKP